MKHFERICVLNLSSREGRRRRLETNLEELGLDWPLEWVRAYTGDKMPPPKWWTAGNGAWGCLLSHSRVVQEALEDGLESVLILEDDVVFSPETELLLATLMEQVPNDWGQVYLGGQHLKEAGDVPGKPFVRRAGCVNRTHAYALHRRAMVPFLQHVWNAPDYAGRPGGWHFDHQLGVAHEEKLWATYCPAWWMAGQAEGPSNVSGRKNPEMWWQPREWSRSLPFVLVHPGFRMEGSEKELHAGRNLVPRSLQDVGLDGALKNGETLKVFLGMIAGEAFETGKLPCLQHVEITAGLIDDIWAGGTVPWVPGRMREVRKKAYGSLRSFAMKGAVS